MDITIGADPELFIWDTKEMRFVSAHDIIPGTKEEPVKIDGGAIQHDGLAAEFNVDPTSNINEFIHNIRKVVGKMEEFLTEDQLLVPVPYAYFGEDYIKSLPEEVQKLGCSPDYNSYTGDVNPMPKTTDGFRTSSGHAHVGWGKDLPIDDPDHFMACRMYVSYMERWFPKNLLSSERNYENLEILRRNLYGNYGAFRPKSYGVEARVFSNYWLTEERKARTLFDQLRASFNSLMKNPEAAEVEACNFVEKEPEEHAFEKYGNIHAKRLFCCGRSHLEMPTLYQIAPNHYKEPKPFEQVQLVIGKKDGKSVISNFDSYSRAFAKALDNPPKRAVSNTIKGRGIDFEVLDELEAFLKEF